jgi:hypothetical protein
VIPTYRVIVDNISFRVARNEWRLSVRSTRPELGVPPHYQAFAPAENEAVDQRLLGLKLVPLRSGDRLDLDLEWAPRTGGDGHVVRRQHVRALRVVPAEALGLSPEDVLLVLAEAKAILDRCPGAAVEQVAETVTDLLDGIVEGVTRAAVLAVVSANHMDAAPAAKDA